MTRGMHLLGSFTRSRVTHTYCRAFGSGAVTTVFSDLGLSRLRFEHPTFRMRGECNNPQRHRCGLADKLDKHDKYYKTFIDWVLRQTLTKQTVYNSSKYVTKKLSCTMKKTLVLYQKLWIFELLW